MSHPHAVVPSIVQQNTDGLIFNLDYDTGGNLTFIGYAPPGSRDTDAAWQIQRLNWVNGKLTSGRYAGMAEFNQSWADRNNLLYT
ncbi:MAG: hypothetical protein HQL90_11570 [Magnetococcales bacterium]|nr:hypothetical protein [Magnetococcales bacterium]